MQDTPRNRQRALQGFWRRSRRWFGLAAGLGLCTALALTTGVVGAWRYVAPGLPEPATIREIPLQIPLRIFSRDGRLIEEVGERRRIIVEFDELQPFVVDAFVAAEDSRFFTHPGVDYQGILRALLITLRTGELSQGGSTITQQLARDYFLTRERLFTRKLREAFLAYRIEQAFTKEEIMALFLNKMFFGQRAYGVAAAAQVYFGKPLQDINVAEAATLAGVLPAPSNYNPVRSPANARMRRDYVLGRMVSLGYIDEAAYEEAMAETLVSRLHGTATELSASYVAEMVRQEMLERYGDDAYTAGYRVVTTIDSRMQRGANYSLRNGLLEFSRRRGYRGPISRIEIDPGTLSGPLVDWPADVRLALESYNSPAGLAVALVTELHEDDSATVVLQDGTEVLLPWHGISWARPFIDVETTGPSPETVADVLAPGDLIHVMRIEAGGYALAQVPLAQAAVVSLDPYDGAITSLAGGFDYSLSKYNRVTQASRQPGSSFKPFIYSAALEQGNTAATIVTDAPVVISSAELEAVWRPVNYSGRFYGEQRLREALVRSMNLASVRLLLNHTGIGNTVRHLQPFGFSDSTLIRNGSLALGGGNASPLDMAQGYAVFANGGYAVDPYVIDSIFGPEDDYLYRAEPAVVCKRCEPVDIDIDIDIEDSTGTIAMYADDDARPGDDPDAGEPFGMSLEEMAGIGETYRPDATEAPSLYRGMKLAPRVIPEQNAYLISDMMRDVIRRGTGVRARVLGRNDLSGKTGTSNDRRDAWFGGFNGDMAAVVWVGYDQDQPLGPGEEGSRTALPIWIEFTRVALAGAPSNQLPMPDGMVNVKISKSTGCQAVASMPPGDVMFEKFREDHVPECEQAEEPDDIFNNDEGFRFGVESAGPRGAGERDGESGEEDEDEEEEDEDEPLF